MTIVIRINTDNAAFVDDFEHELDHVLKALRHQIIDELRLSGGTLRDTNGNECGTWEFTD